MLLNSFTVLSSAQRKANDPLRARSSIRVREIRPTQTVSDDDQVAPVKTRTFRRWEDAWDAVAEENPELSGYEIDAIFCEKFPELKRDSERSYCNPTEDGQVKTTPTMTAKSQWFAEVEKLTATGMTHSQAAVQVDRNFPGLRARMIDESNKPESPVPQAQKPQCDRWNQLVREEMDAQNLRGSAGWLKAAVAIDKKHPGLHEQVIAEANP